MNLNEIVRAPWKQWGTGLDQPAIQQMERACELPISVAGALMPDAHVGYGLPIGGVLATDGVVIPNAVGVDIGCGMAAAAVTGSSGGSARVGEGTMEVCTRALAAA